MKRSYWDYTMKTKHKLTIETDSISNPSNVPFLQNSPQ